jgi:hypothetical protein
MSGTGIEISFCPELQKSLLLHVGRTSRFAWVLSLRKFVAKVHSYARIFANVGREVYEHRLKFAIQSYEGQVVFFHGFVHAGSGFLEGPALQRRCASGGKRQHALRRSDFKHSTTAIEPGIRNSC